MTGGVLVASSDPGLREQLVSTLNKNRWPVLSAQGGADALGKLESSDCDVLLLDRQLSDLDSDELLRVIGEKYPGVEVLQIDGKTRNMIGTPSTVDTGRFGRFSVSRTADRGLPPPIAASAGVAGHRRSGCGACCASSRNGWNRALYGDRRQSTATAGSGAAGGAST